LNEPSGFFSTNGRSSTRVDDERLSASLPIASSFFARSSPASVAAAWTRPRRSLEVGVALARDRGVEHALVDALRVLLERGERLLARAPVGRRERERRERGLERAAQAVVDDDVLGVGRDRRDRGAGRRVGRLAVDDDEHLLRGLGGLHLAREHRFDQRARGGVLRPASAAHRLVRSSPSPVPSFSTTSGGSAALASADHVSASAKTRGRIEVIQREPAPG
jgi:hypothetical protein